MGLSQLGGTAFGFKDQKRWDKTVISDSCQTEETDAELLIREYFLQRGEAEL